MLPAAGEAAVSRTRWKHTVLPLLVLALCTASPARAADPGTKGGDDSGSLAEKMKKAGREFVEDAKAAGRDIRDSKVGRKVEGTARDIGHDAAGTGKKGWDKTKSFSESAAEDVKRATLEFWGDVIRTKEAVAAKLRKENADLKSKKDEAPSRSEPAKEVR